MAVRICGWRGASGTIQSRHYLRTSTVPFGAQPLHDIGIRFNDDNVPDTARVAEGCAIPPISARQQSGSPCVSPSLRRPRVVQQLESADMRSIQSRERLMSTSRL